MKCCVLLLMACLALPATAQDVSPVQSRQAARYDAYGGMIALKGEATGWFHVEQIQNRWYFITPAGNAFFSLGVTRAVDAIKQDELKLCR